MSGYFQTWPYVTDLLKVPILGKPLRWLIRFLCGLRGHELSKTEWGYGGGEYADRWCRWCGKLVVAPKTSLRFEFEESGDLMKQIGRDDGS